MKLLFVDGHEAELQMAQQVMSEAAPEVQFEAHRSRRSALAALSATARAPDDHPPSQMIVCDMRLDDGTALDLLADLRHRSIDLPFIVLTDLQDDMGLLLSMAGQVDDQLSKEGDGLLLLPELLHDALTRRRYQRRLARRRLEVLHLGQLALPPDCQGSHRLGFTQARDLEAARQLLQVQRFDLLLLDAAPAPGLLHEAQQARRLLGLEAPAVLLLRSAPNAVATAAQVRGPTAAQRQRLRQARSQSADTGAQPAMPRGPLRLGGLECIVGDARLEPELAGRLEDIWLRHELFHKRRQLAEVQGAIHEIFSNLGQAFWILDARTECPLYLSPAFAEIFGMPPGVASASWWRWMDAVHPEDRLRLSQQHEALHSGRYDLELRVMHADGQWRQVLMTGYPLRDLLGRVTRLAGLARDVTAQRTEEARISHMAYHDPLTDLPNRALLMDRLAQAVSQARRSRTELAVMFIDIDRFKDINDSLGHEAGDLLLRTIASRLRLALREADTVARMGGDEFVVLLNPIAARAEPAFVAEKLMTVLNEPIEVAQQQVTVTASLGISTYPGDATEAAELLRFADVALYKAKESGRNLYRFFSRDLDENLHRRLGIKNELRQALQQGRLQLHYQSQVDLNSGDIDAVEALLRWVRPDGEIVLPGQFIRIAEESSLIFELGEWVLTEACRQWRRWHEDGLPLASMAVNISTRQLLSPQLLPSLQAALQASEVPAHALQIEITESSLMQRPEHTMELLRRIADQGIQVAMDDFGTGYSNLGILQQLPLSCLKIDRRFIQGLPGDTANDAIVDSIVALAHRMKLSVSAEGVEKTAQCQHLRRIGCDQAQGYLFCRPMPAAAMTDVLRKRQAKAARPVLE